MLKRLPWESLAGDGASGEGADDERERVERVLLRAVLGWIADTAPGRVARLVSARVHAEQPLVWDVVAERSDGNWYLCVVALISDHFAVCLGQPMLLPCQERNFLTHGNGAPQRQGDEG